jgi:very-short-patch-repair endonuclease
METPPMLNTTNKGQRALALADLRLCSRDLTAAYKHATAAETQLTGARLARAVQLAEKIADAIAHAQRLAFFVEGDLHAADEAAEP